MKKIAFLIGPTCSGKTHVSLELAKIIELSIVSADSMQIYQGMNIGTAKVSSDEQSQFRHYLIDIRKANESFSAFEYRQEAISAIDQISHERRLPLVVGGSGLYIKTLMDGMNAYPAASIDVRIRIESEFEEFGSYKMYEKLNEINPERASQLHPNDKKRILRALEIVELREKGLEEVLPSLEALGYESLFVGLQWPRQELYDLVEKRVDQMLDNGLIEEVKSLRDQLSSVNRQAVGYKEIIEYLDGECSLEDAIIEVKKNTRHLVKKQFTWFNKEDRITWVECGCGRDIGDVVNEVSVLIRDFMG